MDVRAAEARHYHLASQEANALAARHRDQRDELIRRLRREDPVTWTYPALARAVGCTPELIAHIVKTKGAPAQAPSSPQTWSKG